MLFTSNKIFLSYQLICCYIFYTLSIVIWMFFVVENFCDCITGVLVMPCNYEKVKENWFSCQPAEKPKESAIWFVSFWTAVFVCNDFLSCAHEAVHPKLHPQFGCIIRPKTYLWIWLYKWFGSNVFYNKSDVHFDKRQKNMHSGYFCWK